MPIMMRPIRGFAGYYAGSNGSIWTAWRLRGRGDGGRGVESYIGQTRKSMKLANHNSGYLAVKLRKDGKTYTFLVHRLVLETFVGPCPEGMECLHKDSNKKNCRLENLRWGTRLENIQDSIDRGTFYNATKAAAEVNRGKKRPQEVRDKISAGNTGQKRTEEQVANLKANHWSKRPDAADIAERSAAKNRGQRHTAEHRAKIAESCRLRWAERRRGNSGRHR